MTLNTKSENIKSTNHKVKISNKTLWIGGGMLLLVGGGFTVFLLMKKRKEKQVLFDINRSGSGLLKRSTGPCSSKEYPLSIGTCHPDVGVLQRHLKSLGMDIGTSGANRDGIDQIFGQKTKAAALKKLGKDTFLLVDVNGIKNALKFVGK